MKGGNSGGKQRRPRHPRDFLVLYRKESIDPKFKSSIENSLHPSRFLLSDGSPRTFVIVVSVSGSLFYLCLKSIPG